MLDTQLTRNDTIYFANKIVVFFISSRGSINSPEKYQFNKTYKNQELQKADGIERGINYFS